MKHILTTIFLMVTFALAAQIQKEDGTWWDNNLTFEVKYEAIKERGELIICIYDTSRDVCVENLMTGYEVVVYDANNKEIWNSLWTGKNMDMKFSRNLPEAHYIIIKAKKAFVVNQLTTTRIYQDKPLELKYMLP